MCFEFMHLLMSRGERSSTTFPFPRAQTPHTPWQSRQRWMQSALKASPLSRLPCNSQSCTFVAWAPMRQTAFMLILFARLILLVACILQYGCCNLCRIVRCTAHQHVGSKCMYLRNLDTDELICSSCPIYGNQTGTASALLVDVNRAAEERAFEMTLLVQMSLAMSLAMWWPSRTMM